MAQAIEILRAQLSTNPDNCALRGRVADAYRRAGNVERAFHHFHKAANLYIRAHDLPGAVRMLDAANRVSPNEPDILFRWSECLVQLGQWSQLRSLLVQLVDATGATGDRRRVWALDRLTALEPDNLDWAVARATALLEAGRNDAAVDAWRRLSPVLSQYRRDWVSGAYAAARRSVARSDHACILAQVLLTNRHPREALALLVPFYDEYPEDLEVLQTVLAALEAMQAWDKLRPARLELLRAHCKRRMRGEALEGVAALLRSYPTDPQVLRDCARACQVFGLAGEASRLRFQLCQLHDRREEHDLRDQVLDELLRDDPTHQGAIEMAVSLHGLAHSVPEVEAPPKTTPYGQMVALTPDKAHRPASSKPTALRRPSSPAAPLSLPRPIPFATAVDEPLLAIVPGQPVESESTAPEDDEPVPIDTAPLDLRAHANDDELGALLGWNEASALLIHDDDVLDAQSERGADPDSELTEDKVLVFSETTYVPGEITLAEEEIANFDDEATVIPDRPVLPTAGRIADVGDTTFSYSDIGPTLSEDLTDSDVDQPASAIRFRGSVAPIPDFGDEPPTRVDFPAWSGVKS